MIDALIALSILATAALGADTFLWMPKRKHHRRAQCQARIRTLERRLGYRNDEVAPGRGIPFYGEAELRAIMQYVKADVRAISGTPGPYTGMTAAKSRILARQRRTEERVRNLESWVGVTCQDPTCAPLMAAGVKACPHGLPSPAYVSRGAHSYVRAGIT